VAELLMRLTDLEPQFIKYVTRAVDPNAFYDGVRHPSGIETTYHHVDAVSAADGICFLCPKCFQQNGGTAGTHGVICWFEGRVADDVDPKPGRWNPTGNGYDDLSFVPGAKSNSVLLLGGCNWHGFVTNGDVTVI
jgi:hypothetical protein